MPGTRAAFILIALLAYVTAAAALEEAVIPSETCRGLWIVPVSFGDGPDETMRLVLDTGAGRTSVDPDAIERVIGRRVAPGKSVRLAHGVAGPLKIRRIKARVHEMDHLGRALGQPIDGILGFPAFRDLLLTLDYPAGEIRVSRGSLPDPDGRTIFRDVGRTRPHLALEIDGDRLAVLVDSGSTSGLTLREGDALSWAIAPRAVSASVRYEGIRLEKAGRLARDIAFGSLTIETPIVELIEEETRLAGEPILRRFAWTFDQRTRRIRMIPDSSDPILSEPLRGTGLALRPTGAGMEVTHIFPGTPGEAAGVLPGDLIVAVDGTPVHERGCTRMIDPGRDAATLAIIRGAERMDQEVPVGVLVP